MPDEVDASHEYAQDSKRDLVKHIHTMYAELEGVRVVQTFN